MGKIRLDCDDEKVEEILGAALDGKIPTKEDLMYLSKQNSIYVNFALFQVARRICELNFGKKIFLYGFVYFSTYCRNSCTFCYYRRPNEKAPRYRKRLEEILDAVAKLEKSDIHLVDLTMGEDPQIHDSKNYESLIEVCKEIKKNYELSIMVSPGVVPREVLKDFAKVGVDWYALYQETHNRTLFTKLRPNQSYDLRMKAKAVAREEGILIEDGILIGVGECEEDVINSIFEMRALGAHQVRAMGLSPQCGTPLEKYPPPPIINEMRAIAMMRLVHQDRLIPASYDIDGLKGLELRIMAGANVITSIIPPGMGLYGVAQPDLDVENGQRTVEALIPYLHRLGLEPATRHSYTKWVEKEKELLRK